MNHREPTSVPQGMGQALPRLALLLLPFLALSRAGSRPNINTPETLVLPTGYLLAVGSPTLRFQENAPPPDLVTRPAASAPPKPPQSESISRPDVLVFTPPPTNNGSLSGAAAEPAASTSELNTEAMPAPHTPAPILRDDLQHQARPEDVLPYFQIPASQSGDVNVIVPVPRSASTPPPLPPSSATYTQSPR
jgi:hypothetical protein